MPDAMSNRTRGMNEGPHGAHHIAPDVHGQNFYAIDRQFQDLMSLYMEPDLRAAMTPHFQRLGQLAGNRLDDLQLRLRLSGLADAQRLHVGRQRLGTEHPGRACRISRGICGPAFRAPLPVRHAAGWPAASMGAGRRLEHAGSRSAVDGFPVEA